MILPQVASLIERLKVQKERQELEKKLSDTKIGSNVVQDAILSISVKPIIRNIISENYPYENEDKIVNQLKGWLSALEEVRCHLQNESKIDTEYIYDVEETIAAIKEVLK